MTTRSKFILQSVKKFNWNQDAEELSFSAVGGGGGENEHFARYTPSGTLTILVDNPNLTGKFTLGAFYYLDITLCETPEG